MTEEQVWQNAFYYSLSTIAQTLAAAFGILATFMLFRFQHAEGKIETHGENINESVLTLDASMSDDLVGRLKEGDADAVQQVISQVIGKAGGKRSAKHEGVKQLRAAGERIFFWSAFHKKAMRWMRLSLLLTVATIGFCLVQLPLLPLLTRRMALAATLTAVAVALSLVCLAMYAHLILLLLVPEAEGMSKPAPR